MARISDLIRAEMAAEKLLAALTAEFAEWKKEGFDRYFVENRQELKTKYEKLQAAMADLLEEWG